MKKKLTERYLENGYKLDENNNLKHREVIRKHDGRIKRGYHVHHCDGIKTNNDISNLIQIPAKLHEQIHKNYSLRNLPSKKHIEEVMLPSFLNLEIKSCPYDVACDEIRKFMAKPKNRKKSFALRQLLKKHFTLREL
jgi:hypothetical protein